MFKLKVEKGLHLALVEPKFAKDYLKIVKKQRDYLSEWLAWPPHAYNEEFFLTFIKSALHSYADGKAMHCAIILDDVVVGNISFNSVNQSLKKVEIGYWLSQKHTGKGIVTKSVVKMIELAFTDFAMQKVQISVAVGNIPSRNVCERLGLTLEGIITNAENLNGRIVDHAVYGLKLADWQNS